VRSVFRTCSLPQGGPQVVGANQKCSESEELAGLPLDVLGQDSTWRWGPTEGLPKPREIMSGQRGSSLDARLRPSAIRAWISSRSNSAIAAKILMVKRPLGVVVSTAVLSLTARLAPRCRPPKNGAIDHPQPGADKVDSAEGMATLGGDEQSSQLPPRAAEQAGVRATDCRAG
jgi:hypothetical protein